MQSHPIVTKQDWIEARREASQHRHHRHRPRTVGLRLGHRSPGNDGGRPIEEAA
jgi:hypothetical protein